MGNYFGFYSNFLSHERNETPRCDVPAETSVDGIKTQEILDSDSHETTERQLTHLELEEKLAVCQQTIDKLTTRDIEKQQTIHYLLTTDRKRQKTLDDYEEAIVSLLHQQRDMKNQYKDITHIDSGKEREMNPLKGKDLKQLTGAISTDVVSVINHLWGKQIINDFTKAHLLNEFKNPLMRVFELYDSVKTPEAYSALYDATIEYQLWDAADILQPENSPHKQQEDLGCFNVSNEVSDQNNDLKEATNQMILLPKEGMLAISRLEDSVSDITSKMESLPMLYKDVNDLKDALLLNQATNQQGSPTDISKDRKATIGFDGLYHFSQYQNVLVDHGCGTFTYNGNELGQLMSAQPLSEEHKSFSLEVVDPGKYCSIIIGVCHIDHPIGRPLGLGDGSVGYNLHTGSIWSESSSIPTKGGQCKKGDVVKCELDFGNRCFRFYRNGVEVGAVTDRDFKPTDFHSLYASIVFYDFKKESDKTVVKALERGPWRL